MESEVKQSLWDLLGKRYEATQGWLLFYEVANKTGSPTGYADAVALSTWPSKGIQMLGFEIKRTRGDLIKELRDEHKAAKFQKFCHAWWLVVGDAKLVDGVEVPASWGILAPRGNVLYQVRPAPKLEPEAWSHGFIASLMRHLHDTHIKKDDQTIKAMAEERAVKLAREQASHDLNRRDDHLKRSLDDLSKRVEEFQAASGININERWSGGNIGGIIEAILDVDRRQGIQTNLELSRVKLAHMNKLVNAALASLKELSGAG